MNVLAAVLWVMAVWGMTFINQADGEVDNWSDWKTSWGCCTHSYHLSDAEAVLEVVEGDVIVASVHFIKKLLQHVQLNVEGGDEVQICVHHLEQHHELSILPLPTTAQNLYFPVNPLLY